MNLPYIGPKKIDHIARVVSSLEEYCGELEAFVGWEASEIEELPEQGVRVMMLSPTQPDATKIELLEPLDRLSSVGRFLSSRGNAVHHIGFSIEDLTQSLSVLLAHGVRLIDSTPRVGAGGKKIAFIHPEVFGGLLVELCEAVPPSEANNE